MGTHIKDSALYLFLHQYKTAGTTLWRHLSPNFPGGSQLFVSGERIGLGGSKRDGHPGVPGFVRDRVDEYVARNSTASTRLLIGHYVYPGIHTLVTGSRTPRYFTFLRHPVERVISLYWFLRHGSDSYWHDEIVDAKWSLEEWLEGSRALWARDGQTRHLLVATHEQACMQRELDPDLLSVAKQTLNDFWFVGLTETFERDSGFLLGRLGATKFAKKNAIRVNARKEPAGPDLYARIAAANQLDMELYEHARRRRLAFIQRRAIAYFWFSIRGNARKREWQSAVTGKDQSQRSAESLNP
jgi:hypothetical protein